MLHPPLPTHLRIRILKKHFPVFDAYQQESEKHPSLISAHRLEVTREVLHDVTLGKGMPESSRLQAHTHTHTERENIPHYKQTKCQHGYSFSQDRVITQT